MQNSHLQKCPKRGQSWGIDIPIAIRAALVEQGLIPSCCCKPTRLSRLLRKAIVKEMQVLAGERQLVHTQVERVTGMTLTTYPAGKVNTQD